MKLEGDITGIGWVNSESMGNCSVTTEFSLDSRLPVLKRKDVLADPYKPFGRMDSFSKIGFSAIAFALDDAGIKHGPENPEKKNISLIAGTTTGCMETDIKYRKTLADNAPSPAVFAYTLDSCFLGEASICFGLAGESFIINEKNTSGLNSLYFALEHLYSDEPDAVVFGLCNSDLNISGPDAPDIVPGAVFFVLEKNPDSSLAKITADSQDHIYDDKKKMIYNLHNLAQRCALKLQHQGVSGKKL